MNHKTLRVITLLISSTLLAGTHRANPFSDVMTNEIEPGHDSIGVQSNQEITEANWESHPRIVAIRKIVKSVDQQLKNGTLKISKKEFESCGEDIYTSRRIARDSKGHVGWYEEYGEGREDSSSLYRQYYDEAGHMRFGLVTVYAANGTREQHRIYFDEAGNVLWKSRKIVKGPGYFAPPDLEDLAKKDPAKDFTNHEGCVAMKPKPKPKPKRATRASGQ